MIIGVDGNEANVKEQVGVSTYTLSLLSRWRKEANQRLQFAVFLSGDPLPHMPPASEYFRYVVVKPALAWSRIFLPVYFFFHKNPDVYFAPAHYSPVFLRCPLVVTIHDLAYHHFPRDFLKKDLYKLTHWTEESLKKAAKIIAVSRNTANDITALYGIASSKISVISNGFDAPGRAPVKKLPLKHPYFLYVGTLQPRKNIAFLIKTFTQFKSDHPEYQLRIAGKKGWLYDKIFKVVASNKLEKDVIFEGYVSEERKSQLYRNASCFVMPSLYEGFNIPLLEALSHGCPVVAADSSSLPEVGGDACLYYDPADTSSLLNRLEIIVRDGAYRKELIAEGKRQAAHFSWEKCAKDTLNVIINAAKQSK